MSGDSMSAIFLNIVAQTKTINFFGLSITVLPKWYEDNYYIAMDRSGGVYVYNAKPYRNGNHHMCQEGKEFVGHCVAYLDAYTEGVYNLREWIDDTWETVYRLQDFPLVSMSNEC